MTTRGGSAIMTGGGGGTGTPMSTPTLTLPARADITPGSPADTDTITRLVAIVLQLISSVLLSHRRITRVAPTLVAICTDLRAHGRWPDVGSFCVERRCAHGGLDDPESDDEASGERAHVYVTLLSVDLL
jgi:hypothetical protein